MSHYSILFFQKQILLKRVWPFASAVLVMLSSCNKRPTKIDATQMKRVEIIVSEKGYEPAQIQVKKGQPITLAFKRIDNSPCGSEVVVKSTNIRKPLPLGETVEISLVPTEKIILTCGMGMLHGAILVH